MKTLAAVAALALVFLVARYDATAQGPRWSQAEAEQRVRATARTLGVDASNWKVTAAATLNGDLMAVVHNQRLAWPDAFSPLRYRVAAVSGRGNDLLAEYAPGGILLRWECHHCAGQTTPDAALRLLAGERAGEFNAQRKWMGAAPAGARLVADISSEDGKVTSAALIVDARPRNTPFFRGLRTTSWILGLVGAGLVVSFRAFRRREARRLVRGIFVFWMAAFVFTLLVEGKRWRDGETLEARQSLAKERAGWFWSNLFVRPFFWALPCAAGLLLLRGRQIEPWVGLLHATERWKPARRSGEELFNGLLLGFPLALTPYAAGAVSGPVWDVISPRIAFENVPSLVGLLQRTNLSGSEAAYFGFLVPLLFTGIRNPKWRWGLLTITGVALFGWMGRLTPVYPWATVAVSLLAGLVSAWIYRGHGLLGLFAAWAGSAMAAPLAWLAGAPSGHMIPLTASLAVYGGSLAGASWLRRKGYPGEDEELMAEILRRNTPTADWAPRSEREQLLAEFAEAREAQQGMLPASAPVIPGYSLAAVCVPAREVGGDLYDFLQFPDGQWGLCVADVSGKGVPAALYMTMTKGVLASAQRLTTNLDDLALALNQPLYEAGRRKTFVTLGLARLDPKTGRVEVIRAGHNPFVWRRADRDETILLQPGGLGLGMVSNKMFGKRLEHQTIEMAPGDTLLLYSDGLTETENSALDLFGEERLMDIARQGDHLDAEGLMREILAEVERFQNGADPHDDLTLMVLKASPSASLLPPNLDRD